MEKAVELSLENMRAGKGGPFGAIIVRQGKIVGTGANHVTSDNDPTAHAEVVAIRDACKNLGTFQLDDCEIYTSCEPCPMCLAAIYWARPKAIYYANTRKDAADIGFDDDFLYEELKKNSKKEVFLSISLIKAMHSRFLMNGRGKLTRLSTKMLRYFFFL